jgi:phosphonate transport system permease protein
MSTYDPIITAVKTDFWTKAAQGGIVLAIICIGSFYTGLLDIERLNEGIPSIVLLMKESFPPDFSDALSWIGPILDSLAMSIAGTALAILISLPLAFLAAKNTTPNATIYQIARAVLNGLRSVPELIMGILFVAAVGFGALPGVLALGLHSIGMVGKFFAESIEHVSDGPVEAVKSTGASPMQIILHGVLPQVMSQIADVSLYRWEYNFRASTVMGMVGAGGIGFELMASLRLMQYQQVSAILLLILLMVTLVDSLGARLRSHFK